MTVDKDDLSDLSSGPAPSEMRNQQFDLFSGASSTGFNSLSPDLRKKWDEDQLDEASTRRLQRGFVFCTVYVLAIMLFFTFGAYVWKFLQFGNKIDHLLLWLLAALPVGLILLLTRLSAEPRAEDSKVSWPDGLVAVAKEGIGVLKEYVSKMTPKG